MHLLALICVWWSLITTTLAGEEGLTGVPANIYDPYCATACLRSFSTLTLSCSSSGITLGMVTFATSTECYAINEPFLTSVAWCAETKCADVDVSAELMEYWWDMQITGQKAAGVYAVPPMWSYGETIARITSPPTLRLTANDTSLNVTSLVSEAVYLEQYNVLTDVQHEGATENIYGLIMLVGGFAVPILLTLVGFIPVLGQITSTLKPYIIWPSTIGTYHVTPLPYLLGNAPTLGQSLYITVFIILNIVLTSVGYQLHQPNAWYSNQWRETVAFVLYRTGNFAYIMMPLIFLFGSRNNILLWLTDWSHSTFLVLHRWIARVFTVQAILHSILALVLYIDEGTYSMNVTMPYWIWGIVGTVCVVVLCFGSGLYIRRFHYEFFLITHIILSAVTVVALWYHAWDLYAFLGGYVDWFYAVFAVWGFDRLARLARIIYAGARYAKVTNIGDAANGYVRVDIPGLRWNNKPGMHAYLYFPSLTPWAPWENHPFSVMPTAMLRLPRDQNNLFKSISQEDSSSLERASFSEDIEKDNVVLSHSSLVKNAKTQVGLSFFIKKTTSITQCLAQCDNLFTLVEGPYLNNPGGQVLKCDRVILIGGGIGITTLASFIANHWNIKLYWSVKESARDLVEELSGVLDQVPEKDVIVGSRLDIKGLLARESEAGWGRIGVVVSGPPQLCDDTRAAVAAEARRSKTAFELEVEAYSW